jgi:heme-degrading monooxygenase HmoA
MYGTVARLRIKPGMEEEARRFATEEDEARIPGFLFQHAYQLDADPHELVVVVAFESKEAYRANAGSTAQHERYLRYRELLAAEPEWHDGEVIASFKVDKADGRIRFGPI